MAEAADRHNKIAPDLLKQIVRTTSTPSAALVIVESIVMGATLYAAGDDPRKAAEYVEHMTQAVLERLAAPPPEQP